MMQRMQPWHVLLALVVIGITLSSSTPPVRAVIMPTVTARGLTWVDADCDGIRQDNEPPLDIRVTLFAAGADGRVGTADDQIIEQSGANGGYRFTLGQPDLDYRLLILPWQEPFGYRLAPYQASDDATIDNDFTTPDVGYDTWATGAFRFDATKTVTGIDLGVCTVPLHYVFLPVTKRS